jgi:hypothetical protein
LSRTPHKNPTKSGIKTAAEPGRPWRQIAGPSLSPRGFALATLPLARELATRLDRKHANYFKSLREAKLQAEERALIKDHHPPVNVLGGHRFPDAPKISPQKTGSGIPPVGPSSPPLDPSPDPLELPAFLDRRREHDVVERGSGTAIEVGQLRARDEVRIG